MAVKLRKDRPQDSTYWCELRLKGERVFESTGATRKREAELWETNKRAEITRRFAEQQTLGTSGARLTIKQACTRYWMEKAEDHVAASRPDALRALTWIAAFFGENKLIADIDDGEVARMIAARRGEFIIRGKRKTDQLISKSTVNRTATFPLRRVLNRAHLIWKCQIQIINWKEHLLAEPQEIVREVSEADEAALLDQLDRGYDDAIRFAYLTGLRRMEILNLDHTDIMWMAGHHGEIIVRGKGDKKRIVPLTPETRAILWAQKDHHPVKVFTYVANCTRILNNGEVIVRGHRYPLTKFCLRKAFDVARGKSGLKQKGVRFHDSRHTMATRFLRDSGNLALVQKLLGHSDPSTTVKYAKALTSDLADAMNAMAARKTNRDGIVNEIPSKSHPMVTNEAASS